MCTQQTKKSSNSYFYLMEGGRGNITFLGTNVKKIVINFFCIVSSSERLEIGISNNFATEILLEKKINRSYLCDFSPEWATIIQKENQLLKP